MTVDCQSYREVNGIEELCALVDKTDYISQLVQLKYDGIWCQVIFDGYRYSILSKTGNTKDRQILKHGQMFPRPCVLIGEYMYGSQWADHPDRKGRIYLFDMVADQGNDLSQLPYNRRYNLLTEMVKWLDDPRFVCVPNYSVSALSELWHEIESKESHEGLILRNWNSTYYTELVKLKREVEDDFIVIDSERGTGQNENRLGAFSVGQYDTAGNIALVMKVGGGYSNEQRQKFWDERVNLEGRVMLVKGKSRFTSGALRHPNFVRFRDDKNPQDCILKRT